MPHLPSGTVTFLFTDIEGSTALWERDRTAMREAVARQLAILQGLITAHHGVVFTVTGDAVQAAFASAEDALRAAVASQRALLAEDWGELGPIRVRMALHAGEAAPDAHGDYLAISLNRLARLLAIGHGSQILLTQAVQQLTRGGVPAGATLRDLGEHRLRDLLDPERVFQVLHPDLPDQFPPLMSLGSHLNNLPLQPTPFLGREQQVQQVVDLVRRPEVRCLTLTGPGGTGKTRLALHAAAELLDDYPDGVYFVPLAALADPALVPSTIASTLGLREGGDQPGAAYLQAFLATKHLLLVLDNVEHLAVAAPAIGELLAAAPGLQVLATSRMPLRLRAEWEYAVPPLGLPRRKPPPTLEQLSQYEAVRLFIARAQAVKADFVVDNASAPAVAEICHRLDGLPLAIELAAARSRMLPPQAMLTRLEQRLPFLTGGARDAPARQRTLRNTITWSYDLLEREEQQLFRQLAVFAGGMTLEAAEAVANLDSQRDIFGCLEQLVEQSLLRQASGTDRDPRFTMLETIREFALEHLVASGEESTIRRRHADYFLRWAEAGKPLFFTLEQGPWFEQLDVEHANVRLALAWLLDHGDGAHSLALACALGPFWRMRGYAAEGLSWVERVLTTEEPASLYVEALVLGSGLALDLHRHGRAAALAETAVAAASSYGTMRDLARAQLRLATVLAVQGDTMRTRQLIGDALRTSREAGDHRTVAWALMAMAFEPMDSGSHDEAIALLHDAMAAARAGECYVTQSSCLYNLGSIAFSRGEGEQAIRFVEEAIALNRRIGDTDGAIIGGQFLGYLRANELGDDAGAALLLEEALAYSRKGGDDHTEAATLTNLGQLATRQGNLALAQSRYEAALRLYQSVGDALTADLGFADAMIGLGDIARAQEDLPLAVARFRQVLERLRPIALERWDGAGNDVLWLRAAVAESLRLYVVTAGSVDNAQQAIRLLGAADAFRTASMNGVLHMERVRHDADAAQLRTRVDAATFDQLWALGHELSVDDALTDALALPLALAHVAP